MTQKATAKDNSLVVQAENDIHIGLNFADCERIFGLLLMENMPKLEQIAMEKARENVEILVQKTYIEIEEKIQSIDITRMSEPDVQSCLNDAVQGAAKKGEKIDIALLSNLIVERLKSDNDNFVDNCIEEAIQIIPKLSKELIYLLPTSFAVAQLGPSILTVDSVEHFFSKIKNNFLIYCENVSEIKLLTLGATGAVNYINIGSYELIKTFKTERYPFLSDIDIENQMPNMWYVLNKYNELNLQKITPTAPGMIIAAKLLEPIFGNIDLFL